MIQQLIDIGDTVRIIKDKQDSDDDGRFEVVANNGDRLQIRTLDYCQNMRFIPVETVLTAWVYKV